MSFSFSDDMADLFGIAPTHNEPEIKEAPDTASIFSKIKSAASASPMFSTNADDLISDEEVNEDPEVQAAIQAIADRAIAAEAAKVAQASGKAEVFTLNDEAAELSRQINELNAKFYAIQDEKRKIEQAAMDRRAAVNRSVRDLEQAERNVAVVKANVVQRKKMSKTVESFGRVAKNFSWFTGIKTPSGDTIKCLDHQWEGIKFLATAGRAILGDAMGLGKTLSAIAGLDLVGSQRALVICPAEVTSNFLREVKRWAPHRNVINLNGKSKIERNMALDMAKHFTPVVVIVNYEAWRKDLSLITRLQDFQFDTLIADEAHTVKGTNTDAFSGVKAITLCDNICPMCGDFMEIGNDKYGDRYCTKDNYRAGQYVYNDTLTQAEKAMLTRSIKNLWLMTGTPILNAPEDLFPMLYLIDPLAFPLKSAYLRDYCIMDMYTGRYRFAPGGMETLVHRISGKYLARTKETSGVILPPQEVILHEIEFADDLHLMQQDIIKQLTKHAQIVLSEDNKMNAIGVLALITRQRQANVWPAGIQIWEHPKDEYGFPMKDEPKVKIFDAGEVQESIKMDKVLDLIMEHGVIEGGRIVVFSQFKTGLAELETRIKALGLRTVRYDGDTSDTLKDQVKTNFDRTMGEEPKWEIVLCNYKTGGVGLNFTAVTHTIILDEEWNPGKRDQAYGRTDRMGQTEDNFVHIIRLKHTVDTWLANLIADKEAMIGGFDVATKDIQIQMLKAIKDGEV